MPEMRWRHIDHSGVQRCFKAVPQVWRVAICVIGQDGKSDQGRAFYGVSPMKGRGITEHALLRYIERVAGVDMDALAAHIITPDVQRAIEAKARTYKTSQCTYVIKGGQIITILGKGQRAFHRVEQANISEASV
jgi:hypothetical protein